MKKTIYVILVLFLCLIVPNIIKAEVIGITQEDFDRAKETGELSNGVGYDKDGFEIYFLESGEYRLDSDINYDTTSGEVALWLEDKDIILNLNNKTMSGSHFSIGIKGGYLTINGPGTIIGDEDSSDPMLQDKHSIITHNTNLTINGGTFYGTIIASDESTVTINGGSFYSEGISLGAVYTWGENC